MRCFLSNPDTRALHLISPKRTSYLETLSLSGDKRQAEPKLKRIKTYIRSNGKAPFEEWITSIRDKSIAAKIFTRIDRLRLGNFGDCKSVGDGVSEVRLHFGSGYRIYFGVVGSDVVLLLLLGGEKSFQKKDIEKAKLFWKEFSNG